MMNWIWFGLIAISLLVGAFQGQMQAVTLASFESAKKAVEFAIGLVGVMAFWLGLMKVAEQSGLMRIIARGLRRPMRFLFPDVPEEHPAMSAMIMTFAANLLGLANAVTPLGISAMAELNKLNRHPGTATNAMCLFLAINTSHITFLATGVIALRASSGSADPACIWIPTLIASACGTVTGIIAAKLLQRLRRYDLPVIESADLAKADVLDTNATAAPEQPPELKPAGIGVRAVVWLTLAGLCAGVVVHYTRLVARLSAVGEAAEHWQTAAPWLPPLFGELLKPGQLSAMDVFKDLSSFWSIPFLMAGILLFGAARGVKLYEAVVEGAREGFNVAIRIIPFLVAILTAVGMARASGAMDLLAGTLGRLTAFVGLPPEALPMVLIRPLSGSGAYGYMASIFETHGPDSFIGKLVSVLNGSADTTFYILAVYFGSVHITRIRHSLPAGLLADLAGVIAGVVVAHLFFGG